MAEDGLVARERPGARQAERHVAALQGDRGEEALEGVRVGVGLGVQGDPQREHVEVADFAEEL